MKYFIRIILILIFLFIMRIALPLLELYPYKLTKDYYLIGTGNKNYIIKDGLLGKTLVNNMYRYGEWIITPNEIYGIKGNRFNLSDNYFYIDRAKDSVTTFEDLTALNKFLKKKGFEGYSMSKSENLVHLKYGNGRDRKFKE